MNNTDLRARIASGRTTAQLYFVLRNGGIRRVNLEKDSRRGLAENCLTAIKKELEPDLLKGGPIPDYTQHDNERSSVYRYDLTMSERLEEYASVFANQDRKPNIAEESDIENVIGYLIKIGTGAETFGIFRHHVAINTFKPARFMLVFNSDNQFERVTKPQIQLDSLVDMLWVDGEMYVVNLKAVESLDEVKKETQKNAQDYVEEIGKSAFVDDLVRLKQLVDKDLAFARRLIRLRNSGSKVLSLPKNKVFDFISKHKKYRERFTVVVDGESRRFVLHSEDTCRDFGTLLNDDFLRSELTGEDYEVVHKKDIPETEAKPTK